ncbi:uncharacterized protein CTRU02_207573 [Colletotrichum truncatum]|uniref:Uncharacterized protein n=1 Tax=Colletotrichum truncatum TaxID=5467 RepID=A0ACC3Z174_COLTU|nr:uncharacterized protein CTRU02_00795 [Colletotrichum truncatum]KAF6800390.1 hypothetical protein CTRU02_00795 [Colletotrichum truncatum]
MLSQRGSLTGPGWVEYDPNSAPQVVVEAAPEAVIRMHDFGIGNDGVIDTHSPPSDIVTPESCFGTRLWKHRRILIVIALLLLSAIVVPIVVIQAINMSRQQYQENGPGSGFSTTLAASTTTAKHYSTAMLLSPTSTSKPASRCDSAIFRRDVNWIGIFGGSDWKYNLTSAHNPQECCNTCYHHVPEGCNGWLYVETDTNTPPCNIILGYPGPNQSKSCPRGYPDLVFNNAIKTLPPGEGGAGPCTDKIMG